MAKKSSIEARLSLTTDGWKKGLDDAAVATEKFKRRAEAAMAFNAGGPAQSRAGLEQRLKLEGMGLQPMGGTSITGIKMRPRAMETPFEDPAYVSRLKKQMEGVNGEMDRLRHSGRNGGMGMLELSRAFEDAQYGMRGVMNNIPGIVQSFGGSAGLAGAASFAAVSGYMLVKAWDDLQITLGNKENPAAAAAAQRKLAEAVQETRRRVDESVEAYDRLYGAGLAERREGALDYLDREAAAQNSVAEAQLAVVQAQNAALEGAARMKADNAARFKTEEASLNRQVELMKKKVEFESQYAADSYNRLQALKQQLDALPRTSFTTTDVYGNRATRVEAQDKNKEDEIKRKIAIEEATLRRSAATKNAAVQQQEDAEHYRKNILPLKKKAAEQELKNAEASELKETARKRQKQMVDVFDLMGDVADIANDALKDAARKMEQLQEEARRLQETREDAAVDHLRRRGRGAAADRRERKLTEKRRAAELEAEGMSPEEAKAQAAQERVDSRRGIRGAPARQFEGIDAFRRGSMPRPDFPALDNRRAPSASSRRVPAAADAPKAASPEAAATKESADRVVAAIDTLRTTLQPPVADKLKAA